MPQNGCVLSCSFRQTYSIPKHLSPAYSTGDKIEHHLSKSALTRAIRLHDHTPAREATHTSLHLSLLTDAVRSSNKGRQQRRPGNTSLGLGGGDKHTRQHTRHDHARTRRRTAPHRTHAPLPPPNRDQSPLRTHHISIPATRPWYRHQTGGLICRYNTHLLRASEEGLPFVGVVFFQEALVHHGKLAAAIQLLVLQKKKKNTHTHREIKVGWISCAKRRRSVILLAGAR